MSVNKDDYAIVIGIDKYSLLPRLSGAREDAVTFADWLQNKEGGGLLPEHIELILSPDKSPEPAQMPLPLQAQVDNALKRFKIIHKKWIGRRLYFYFSGHGYGQYDDIGMFMAPASTDQLNYNIGLRQYKIFLSQWGFFDEMVFILDCCRDPFCYGEPQKPSFTFPPHEIPNPAPKVENFVVLATDHGRQSFSVWDDNTGKKRGILTRAVIEGLGENLATDGKGRITASSLRDYVIGRVPQIAKAHDLEQGAEILRPSLGEIIFKEGIIKMQQVGILIPHGVNALIILNVKLKKIAHYVLDENSAVWNFNYLTDNPEEQKFLQHISFSNSDPDGVVIMVNMIQNEWYALEPSQGEMKPLNLKEIDSNRADFVFEFE